MGNGGERYLREDVYNRHGHVPSNGDWVNVKRPRNTDMGWDAAQNEAIAEYHGIPAGFEDQVVSAATIAELESALGIPAGKLEQTVTDFNKMANDGYDPAFFRAAETMRAFGEGPFYAIEMIQAFLNTQGGARRNARAEVVGTDGEPIPHLYSAGEFGGMTPYQYNGGGNMAECLIFGQLAGVGAAAEKDPLPVLPMGVASEIVYTQGRTRAPKAVSNRTLIERNNLSNPVYVGDTAGDASAAREAEIDFIYAEYGFGEVEPSLYVGVIDSFKELKDILL